MLSVGAFMVTVAVPGQEGLEPTDSVVAPLASLRLIEIGLLKVAAPALLLIWLPSLSYA